MQRQAEQSMKQLHSVKCHEQIRLLAVQQSSVQTLWMTVCKYGLRDSSHGGNTAPHHPTLLQRVCMIQVSKLWTSTQIT